MGTDLSNSWLGLYGVQRVLRLHELMDFAGYTRVGYDASCNDPSISFKQRRMIDLDRNKGAANEGVLFLNVSSRLVHVALYTTWNVTGIPNNVPFFFVSIRVDIHW